MFTPRRSCLLGIYPFDHWCRGLLPVLSDSRIATLSFLLLVLTDQYLATQNKKLVTAFLSRRICLMFSASAGSLEHGTALGPSFPPLYHILLLVCSVGVNPAYKPKEGKNSERSTIIMAQRTSSVILYGLCLRIRFIRYTEDDIIAFGCGTLIAL